jgi:hypothetical protein
MRLITPFSETQRKLVCGSMQYSCSTVNFVAIDFLYPVCERQYQLDVHISKKKENRFQNALRPIPNLPNVVVEWLTLLLRIRSCQILPHSSSFTYHPIFDTI